MPLSPIIGLPGICKSASDYASGKTAGYAQSRALAGRYTDANHVRFVAGLPEKIGGWAAVGGIAATETTPRVLRSWMGPTGVQWLGVGTESLVYYYDGSTLHEITPQTAIIQSTVGGTRSITSAAGSTLYTISDSVLALAVEVGDFVYAYTSATIGGVTLNRWGVVTIAGSPITVDFGLAAVSTQTISNTAGSVQFLATALDLAITTLATTNGSPIVQLTHNNPAAPLYIGSIKTGDSVWFTRTNAVNGITLSGRYVATVIATVPGGLFTIQLTASNNANATGSGQPNGTMRVAASTKTAQALGTKNAQPGWTFAQYGNWLVMAPINGTIYVFNETFASRAYPLGNAPGNVQGIVCTPERFIFALGTGPGLGTLPSQLWTTANPLQMAWCDQIDPTVWSALPTNTANQGRAKIGGASFIGGLPVRDGVSLLFTDKASFQANYSGDNYVYDTPQISDNSGLVSPWAIAAQGESAFWMSDSDFWMWSGIIQKMPSDDIHDYVYSNINLAYLGKCFAFTIRHKNEVWFNYPSAQSSEIDTYVIYHIDQQCWSIGSWAGLAGSGKRTCGIDAYLFAYPILGDVAGVLYNHENGTDDNGSALDANITFAPIDVSNGTANVDVCGFIPDFTRLAQSISLTINTRLYPQDPNTVSGPYTITATDTTPRIDLRSDGKMVGFELDSNVLGGDFRFGVPRLDIQQAGLRA